MTHELFKQIERETMATTLLEKLGFSDRDRREPMHDAACDYLAEKADRLVALFRYTSDRGVSTIREEHLTRRGMTVGFIDLHVEAPGPAHIFVEVKWSEYQVSDAIRQICVYRDTVDTGAYGPKYWVLAAPHELNAEQDSALTSQNITFIQLDRASVEAFAKARRAAKVQSHVF